MGKNFRNTLYMFMVFNTAKVNPLNTAVLGWHLKYYYYLIISFF